MRTGRRWGRVTGWAGALALAAATVSACSTAAVGEQPKAPTAELGSAAPTATGSGSGTAQTCDPTASSPAPSATAVDGADVQAIKKRGYIRVGVSADQYLTGYLASDGDEEGFDIDLAHALAKSLFGDPGKVQFVALTTAERIPDLQDKKVDVVIDTMTITCDRLQQVGFSAVYFEASQRLLVDKGSPYTSISALKNQAVCAQAGSTSIGQIQKAGAKVVAVTNVSDCLVDLQVNEVSAVSTDETLLAGLAAQDPNLVLVGDPLEPEPYGIAVPLHQTDVEQWVNGVLAQYESDGEWANSYQKWFFEHGLPAAQPPVAQYSH
ncbi:glutamate ABC transporter substrate-binding protein [Actinospica robiniae]|uniref:glutamate ABC transporter substrate-binding protein n=1 Tax=Actinospica robiniae TaxID=304901 RepID=UPI0003FA6A99|nr:glutamate ABC transporter substrate-binding protein [Actinospica robiniae]